MAVDLLNTSFSDIDVNFVKSFLNIEPDFTDDDVLLNMAIVAVKDGILKNTGVTIEELDASPVINIVYLKMIADVYSGRGNDKNTDFDVLLKWALNNVRTPSL
jgi:hypothetical protein